MAEVIGNLMGTFNGIDTFSGVLKKDGLFQITLLEKKATQSWDLQVASGKATFVTQNYTAIKNKYTTEDLGGYREIVFSADEAGTNGYIELVASHMQSG